MNFKGKCNIQRLLLLPTTMLEASDFCQLNYSYRWKDLELFMNVRQWYVSEESEHIDGAYWGDDDEHHLVEIRCKQLYENSVHCTYLNGSKK